MPVRKKSFGDEMADTMKIHEFAKRNTKILALKPEREHLTGVTKTHMVDGLRCKIEERPWKLQVSMPLKVGRRDGAPPARSAAARRQVAL